METISVVIPIYNASAYLRRCIDSVLLQTHADLELLLVDDGSTDGSARICDEYAKADSRVTAIHQPNGGEMAARAAGVRQARGTWVCFVDADDRIAPDALEAMLRETAAGVDMVVFEHDKDLPLAASDYGCLLLRFRQLAVWGKLYRRALLDERVMGVPRKFRVGEDFLMQMRLLANLKGAVRLCAQRKYIYTTDNPGSVQRSHRGSYEYECDVIAEVERSMAQIDASPALRRAFLGWRLAYLGGMMGLRYPLCPTDAWLVRLEADTKGVALGWRERLALKALHRPALRTAFVAEKRLKRMARALLKHS